MGLCKKNTLHEIGTLRTIYSIPKNFEQCERAGLVQSQAKNYKTAFIHRSSQGVKMRNGYDGWVRWMEMVAKNG